jgi:hypothetical protein
MHGTLTNFELDALDLSFRHRTMVVLASMVRNAGGSEDDVRAALDALPLPGECRVSDLWEGLERHDGEGEDAIVRIVSR